MQDPNTHQTDLDAVIGSQAESGGESEPGSAPAAPEKAVARPKAPGLKIARRFTEPGEDVWSTVEWEKRSAIITDGKGEIVFEQHDVEVPKTWTQLATNVVASKYFRGHIGTPERESSARQLIQRVSYTMADWGKAMGYFASESDYLAFRDELTHLLLHQKAAFNSPVWFNVGLADQPRPQSSACFINSVKDTMESILTLARTEGMLFKFGSGTGTNLSPLRSSHEHLQGGGTASGPVSFMRGYDAFAGVIKCLTPDAYVYTDRGLRPLHEIIDPNLAPGFHSDTSVVLATKDGPTRISHVYVSPEAETYRLNLRHTGLSLRGTGEHPVLTLTPDFRLEWKRLLDLVPGDRVAVSRRAEMWPAEAPSFQDFQPKAKAAKKRLAYPAEMTPEMARLLGYMVAEGCLDDERFRFCNADREVFDDFLACVRSVFGTDPSGNVRARVHPKTGVTTWMFEACWTNAVRFLKHAGLTVAASDAKSVPWSIRCAPRSLVVEFLRAYFEGDGHVSTHVYAASASEGLLREIQLLLLNMGMVPQLRRHPVNGKTYWCLYLRGEQAWTFVRDIGFISSRKRGAAEFAGDKNTNIDVVPFLVDVLRPYTSGNGFFRCADGATRFLSFGFFNRRQGAGISYDRLRSTPGVVDKVRTLDPAKADTLATILEQELFWDAVASVDPDAPAVTYDFTVPETHSFVANGIVNHNSGGKCFKKGTLVSTPDGWVPIETLQVGDMVLTHKGPRPVADFMPNGWKPCYRVRASEGYEVEVTRGHKFAYWDISEGGFRVKPIEEFAPGESLYVLLESSEGGTTIPLIVPEPHDPLQATTTAEMQFPTELSEELAYVIGLTYGDADVRTEYPYRVRVAFCKDDAGRASAERFCQYGERLFGAPPLLLSDEKGHQQIGYTRKRLVEFLTANGLAKGKAEKLGFPKMLFQARPEVRAAFIAGVIDADGTYQRRGGWCISSIDRAFLTELQRLLLTLGIPSKIKLNREPRGNWKPLYRLSIVGSTFVARLPKRIAAHSAKAAFNYTPSDSADKGWGYRPSLYTALVSRVERRGGYRLVERKVGLNETTGYGALACLTAHPHTAIAEYAEQLTHCVQVTLESVEPTETAETYDIEVEDAHLLSANGFYASNTRRAAKMVILNIDHPDVPAFIRCKAEEEKKAWALIDAGYNGNFNVPGGAYDSVSYQNANHSVRVTDEFMEAFLNGKSWQTREVLTGKVAETYKAADLMKEIADAAWVCGDPGMQYDTTINRWHTCKATDRIHASNPCAEFMFLNDTSCNLASINLMKFRREDGEVDVEGYKHACRILITAQEIIVDNASYPTEAITQNSHDYRPLGLGYANLGALLMSRGVAYDSDAGRALAGALTAIMTGEAYYQSAIIARDHGWPFPGYAKNRDAFLDVMHLHRASIEQIDEKLVPADVMASARSCWDNAIALGEKHGYRNAQASVLAPTGTISFLMDCDTTGVEPDIAIVKYKSLVGGGLMKIVNNTVPEALRRLGYSPAEVNGIIKYIDEHDTIEGAPELKPEHLPIFDCAFKPTNGERSIHYMGHIKMMAATQPFISGAISKTVNMPTEATAEDIMEVYIEGWKLGLKAIAIYRDGSKRTQPLTTKRADDKPKVAANERGGEALSREEEAAETVTVRVPIPPETSGAARLSAETSGPARLPAEARPVRRKLPDERESITHKFSIAGHEGYITVGKYDDGTPGEIFLTMSKEGSTISGLMDTIATMTSLALQYGVPLETLVSKFAHTRFEPSGLTPNPDIRFAKSIPDYIFRWLGLKFLPKDAQPDEEKSLNGNGLTEMPPAATQAAQTDASQPTPHAQSNPFTMREREIFENMADAPACAECGALMVRNGACYKCLNCGSVFGCS